MTPARLAALTAIVDLATRIEWAADPDDALDMCAEFPLRIRALVEVLGDEGAKAGTVEEIDVDARTITVFDTPGAPKAERLATQCGLTREDGVPDCWSDEGRGRVWRLPDGMWRVWDSPVRFLTELDALRAYAASVGK